jgi:hypothetical protein
MPDLLLTTIPKANIPTTIAYEDEANTFAAKQTIAKTSEASTKEVIFDSSVSDASGSHLRIENYTATDAHFSPRIWGYYAQAGNISPGLTIDGYILNSQDSGAVPINQYRAVKNDGSAITTRPLFAFYDFVTLKTTLMPTYWDFQNNGLRNFRYNETAKTTSYTLTTSDSIIRADASAGAFTLTLPAASANAGLTYTIIRTDVVESVNLLTIDANASELIAGNLTYILYPSDVITIECDGTGWNMIGNATTITHPGARFRKGATANRRYIAGMVLNSTLITSTTGPLVDRLYAIPIYVAQITKFDTIEAEVTTLGTGSNLRLGIYRDSGNCYPGALMFDSGNISAGSAGAKSATITAGIQIFQPGLYWLAYENSATVPQVRGLPGLSTCMPVIGWDSPFGVATGGVAYSVAHTVGALPNPYTTAATIMTTSTVGAPIPAVALRAV